MGLYDQAVASNQNIWQQKLQQPSAVGRFMESLRRGQEGLAQRKSQEQQLQAKMQAEEADRQLKMQEAQRKAESDKVNKVRIFTNVMSNAGDPDKAARFLSTIAPESNADWMELAQSYKAQSGMGLGAARQQATTDMMTEQAAGSRVNRQLNEQYGAPMREAQIANWKARTERTEKLPIGGSGGAGNGLPGGGIRQIVPQEPGQPTIVVYRDGTTGYLPKPDTGIPDPVQTPRKEIPAGIVKDTARQKANSVEIDQALDALRNNRSAFGLKYKVIPDVVAQRTDPDGYTVRSKAAKIAAVMIHELTGAAQTKAEVDRLQGFLPMLGDTDTTVENKLLGLKREYERYMNQTGAAYGGGGYRPNPIVGGEIPTFASPNDPGFMQLPSGSQFYDANGKLRKKK